MNVKKSLRKIPQLVALKRWTHSQFETIAYNNLMANLPTYRERGNQVASALNQFHQSLALSDAHWVEKIEDERASLLGRSEQLVDGTLGEGGLYDKNVTIQMACGVSKPPLPALFLYHLVRAIKPARILELGTNVGISGAFLAAALAENGQNGALVTCDSSPYRQRLAKKMHVRLGLGNVTYVNGLFTDTLTSTLKSMGGIDLAFIDGHHQYQSTLDYFREIFDYAESSAIFVFDDIRWSDGMIQAWKELQSDTRLGMVIDLTSVGIAIARVGEGRRFISRRTRLF